MPVNFTEFDTDEAIDSAALNARFADLDDAIEALADGSKTLSAPTISSFANAEHDHEDSAGGGQLTLAALDLTGSTDGDVVQVLSGAAVAAPIGKIPTGAMLPYGGSSAPTGYLLCDGQAVSRSTYATLFGVIAETYGVGDGVTTFNLPDLRGRIPGGLDNMGGSSANRVTDASADSLGGDMGEETHTLTEAELAVHDHSLIIAPNSGSAVDRLGEFARTTSNTATTTETAGGGQAHNNVQPTLFLNFIIKT